jgi:SAM-dependent methyltransferase
VIAAACETGVADAISTAARTADAVAGLRGLHPAGTRALLGAMTALGLASREGHAYRLTPEGAPLASDHPETVARIVAKEWRFYDAWRGLGATVRDGHARMAPWPERLAGDRERSLRFLQALDDLGAMFGAGLAEAARLDGARTLLDAGGGSGIHGAHLVSRHPGLAVTVLDLEPVGELVARLHPELAFVTDDLHAPRFGRPSYERYDAVLLANVLHDHPPAICARLVFEAAALLQPGGTLVVYEWLRHDEGDDPPDLALFALMMMVENEGGAAYTEVEVREWLGQAGLHDVEVRRPGGPIAVISGRS